MIYTVYGKIGVFLCAFPPFSNFSFGLAATTNISMTETASKEQETTE